MHVAAWLVGAQRVEDAVDGGPRGFVGALHGGQVGVGAHEIGSEEKVSDAGVGVRAVRPRPGGVDQQRFGVGGLTGVGELDRRVQEPRHDVGLGQRAVVDVVDQLRPHLLPDLVLGARFGDLAGDPPRHIPRRDVDRQDALDPPVTALFQIHRRPELALRDRGQRPFGVDEDGVAVLQRHVGVQVEHHAGHPVPAQPEHACQRRVGRAHRRGHQLAQALHRQRGEIVVGDDLLGAVGGGHGDAGQSAASAVDAGDVATRP